MRRRESTANQPKQKDEMTHHNMTCVSHIVREDIRLYSGIIQSIIVLIVFALLYVDFSLIITFCNNYSKPSLQNFYWIFYQSHCVLSECQRMTIATSFFIIYFFTLLAYLYDHYQMKDGGYRLYEAFLIFLAWSGGWAIVWMFILFFKYEARYIESSLFRRLLLAATLASASGPLFYCLYFLR